MSFLRVVLVIFSLLTLNFSVTAKILVELNEFPEWFQEAAARTIEVKSETLIEIENFNVKSKIKGKAELSSAEDGVWYYIIDIGTSSPVECYVFTTFDGPANSLHAIVEHSLGGVERLNDKKLASRFNYALDVGLVDDTPYMALDTLYNLTDGKETVAGVLKGLSARTNNSLQICIHNEIGYEEAFTGVFESFVGAFISSESNPEFFEVVYKLEANDMPIGYSLEKYSLDEDGDVYVQTQDAMIMPVDSQSVSRSDSVSTEYSQPDGSLINADTYSIENSVLSSQFSIQYIDEAWQVEGQLQGKELSQTLEYSDWLLSSFGSYLETVILQESKDTSAQYSIWVSEINPTAAMTLELSKLSDREDANIRVAMGPLKIDFLADSNGIFQEGSFGQGPMKMNMGLMYVKGLPKIP
ncbi:hypothetical protein [Glaciecola petra]|uniref:Lipoprotein n=1 Tax=Glaciecola petra TaxID=3075602 RepID=A0ABU2ZSI7_9ALTE|nr:hypothetical protein [Aestuariibacter sp. P117]MDT0594397.1 hypothetical protein [Aestuariibacter sp. P117]